MNRTKIAIVGVVAAALLLAFVLTRKDTPADNDAAVAAKTSSAARVSAAKKKEPFRSPASRDPASIAGTITSATGEAIAGAQVCVSPNGEDISEEDRREPRCTKSDASGHYLLGNLWPARYRPSASADGFLATHYVPKDKGGRMTFLLGEGEEKTGLDLVLKPGGVEVLGKVLDIGGGTVAGASVYGWGGNRWNSQSYSVTTTTNDGTFRLWLPKGRISLSAEAEGYAEGSADGIAPGLGIEILLTPEAVLAGRVVEADSGKAMPNVLVDAGHLEEGMWGFSSIRGSAFSDANGHFRITRLPPGRYKPSARADGAYGEVPASVLLGLGQTVDDLAIELRAAFQVHGRLVAGAEQKPCENGWVRLKRSGAREQEYEKCEDGAVSFKALLPGTYEVSARCEGFVAKDDYEDIVVAKADVTGLLWQAADGATIEGTVRNAAGEALAAASVQIEGVLGADPRAAIPQGWANTDDEGHYETALTPGAAKVTVQADGYAMSEAAEVALSLGETSSVDVVLSDGGRIVGVVVDEDGVPVSNAEVHAFDPLQRGRWSRFGGGRTRDDGRFELKGVSPGNYRVLVNDMRESGKTDDDMVGTKVEVKADKQSDVRLVVEARNQEISGQVLSGGQPVTDAYVHAIRESDAAGAQPGRRRRGGMWGGGGRPVLTDMEGRFTLKALSKGNYTVDAYRKGGGSAVQEGISTGSEVELNIHDTGSIAGRVVVADVPQVFTIVIEDRKAGVQRRERFVGTEGTFLMADLPAGEYGCSVQTIDGRASTEIVLAAGQAVENVELAVESLGTVRGQVVDFDSGEPVPGIQIMVTPKGDMSGMMMAKSAGKTNVSDAEGRFVVKQVATGSVQLIGFPVDREQSSYEFLMKPLELKGGEDVEVGALKMIKKKLKDNEAPGDKGFTIKQPSPGTAMVDFKLEVALIQPDGPAADSGLKVGDVIVSVNGHQVGDDLAISWGLTQVPEGTTLKFGLERGETIEITLGPPRDE